MSGEILFLAHRSPYPPDRGDKIRSWHLFRHIAALAPTHLVALYDDARDLMHLAVLEGVAASVALEPRLISKPRAAVNALFSGGSASVAAFASKAAQRMSIICLPLGQSRRFLLTQGKWRSSCP
jgi:polysaccharide biosynthesis protein PslH